MRLQSLVICLRMHFSKDPIVSSTAGAAIRQLVPLLFEKALEESRLESPNSGTLKIIHGFKLLLFVFSGNFALNRRESFFRRRLAFWFTTRWRLLCARNSRPMRRWYFLLAPSEFPTVFAAVWSIKPNFSMKMIHRNVFKEKSFKMFDLVVQMCHSRGFFFFFPVFFSFFPFFFSFFLFLLNSVFWIFVFEVKIVFFFRICASW